MKAEATPGLPFHRERLLLVGRLALLAPVPLALNDSLAPPELLLYLALACVPLLLAARGRVVRVPDWALNLLGVLLLVGFYADLRMGTRSLLKATIHLLLATTLTKLVSVVRERDFATLLLLVTFLFVASVATSFHSTVLVYVAAFALVAWPVLVRWALFRDLAEARSEWERDPQARELPGLRPVAASLAVTFALAAPFFVLLPRIRTPYVRGQSAGQEIWTGFTESVDPGVSGRLKQSDEVVLRVEPDGNVPAEAFALDLRFRALAFATYEDRTWKKPRGPSRILRPDGRGRIPLGAPGADSTGSMLVDLAPLGSRYLPLPSGALALSLTGSATRLPGGAWVERDRLENVLVAVEPQRGFAYEVQTGPASPRDLLPPGPEDPTLVPLGSDRVAAFVREVAGGADPLSQPVQVARRLEAHLAGTFGYSLEIPLSGEKPVEEFLFTRREGHCEAFATAMALALREVGIPSRFVTGFAGAEPALWGRTFIVRGRNAHAWVEAWCGPELGWVTFDPTPAIGRPGLGESDLFSRLRNLGESVELVYDRWVLSFGQADQEDLADRVRSAVQSASLVARRLGKALSGSPLFLGGLAAAAAGLLLFLASGRLRRLLRLPSLGDPATTPGLATYRRMQRTLRRRGASLTASAAPGETVAAAARFGPEASRLSREIVRAYVRESFGGAASGEGERDRLGRLLRELGRALSAPPGPGP